MTMGLIFWIIMLLCLLWSLPFNKWAPAYPYGGSLITFVLLGLLGWQVFGPAIRG